MSMNAAKEDLLHVEDMLKAYQSLKDVVVHTPLQRNDVYSEKYGCDVYIKREDLQYVRSFKLRGAFYKMKKVAHLVKDYGVVCASAGNHAQGVAYACAELGIHGTIFMPQTTPKQKVHQVELFGRNQVDIILTGDTFDEAYKAAQAFTVEGGKTFIHPFDDLDVMSGQGTVGIEILNDIEKPVDYVFSSIGGGGLMAGMSTYIKNISPQTKMIGVEPEGAASMKHAFSTGRVEALASIDKFVDGAAVQCAGEQTYAICQKYVSDIVAVPEGKACTAILDLYNAHAIIAEPAGALPIAALDFYQEEIKGKTVVCVISGGNNDISRMQEIKEKSLMYEGYLYYFIINFPQRAGALREFLDHVLGPDDDIISFEYTKKHNKESGPGLVGIELKNRDDYEGLIDRLQTFGFPYKEVNKDNTLFELLV